MLRGLLLSLLACGLLKQTAPQRSNLIASVNGPLDRTACGGGRKPARVGESSLCPEVIERVQKGVGAGGLERHINAAHVHAEKPAQRVAPNCVNCFLAAQRLHQLVHGVRWIGRGPDNVIERDVRLREPLTNWGNSLVVASRLRDEVLVEQVGDVPAPHCLLCGVCAEFLHVRQWGVLQQTGVLGCRPGLRQRREPAR